MTSKQQRTTDLPVLYVKPWEGILTTDDRPSQASLDGVRFVFRFCHYRELIAFAAGKYELRPVTDAPAE